LLLIELKCKGKEFNYFSFLQILFSAWIFVFLSPLKRQAVFFFVVLKSFPLLLGSKGTAFLYNQAFY